MSTPQNDVDVLKIPLYNKSEYIIDIMRLAKASGMHNIMNESANPCEDFYEFCCGKWTKINSAKNVISTGFFETISNSMHFKVSQWLDTKDTAAGDTAAEQKMKKFYHSCMELRNTPAERIQNKLLDLISEFGAMPALVGDAWNDHDFDWIQLVAEMKYKYDVSVILAPDILTDYRQNTRKLVYLGQAELLLESKSMYLDEARHYYRSRYLQKIAAQLGKYFHMPGNLDLVTAKEILDFEIELAKGMLDDKSSDGLEETAIPSTLAEMDRKYKPEIDFTKFTSISLGENYTGPIYESVHEYQENVKDLIRRTPKRILANYIYYIFLSEFIPLSAHTAKGQKSICDDLIRKYFSKVIDHMIYRGSTSTKTEHDVDVVWQALKGAFERELSSGKLNWIAVETRRSALEKLNVMKLEVNSYAKKNFTEEFGELVIREDDFIENLKNIYALHAKQSREALHQPAKPAEPGEVLSISPVNIILSNSIKIPVAILQPYYLWDDNYPTALKYGSLGFLIGHELIHGFDDDGRKYDKYGNSNNWWDATSEARFEERKKCFVNQYHKYIFNAQQLPRSGSQAENIADNGGIRLAYDAYLKWYEDSKWLNRDLQYETLPGLNYTSKQLFFISFAQLWCSDINPYYRDMQTLIDDHTPGMYRVIGSLANLPEFAEQFHCTDASMMNPAKRCEIY